MELEMESNWIVCVQCDDEFEFTIADQVRYAKKRFEAPKRCPPCRKHKSKVICLDRKREAKSKKIIYRDKKEREH